MKIAKTLPGVSVLALGLVVVITGLFGAALWSAAAVKAGQSLGDWLTRPMQVITLLFGYPAWLMTQGARGQGRGEKRRGIVAVLLVLLILLVGFSRIYVGVHFPGDVLWGWAVGLLLLALFVWVRPRAAVWLKGLPLSSHVLLACAAATLPLVLNLSTLAIPAGSGPAFGAIYAEARHTALADAANLSGMILGLWVGLALEARYLRFSVSGQAWKRLLRYVLGIIGLFAMWMGLRLSFPQEPLVLGLALRIVRYGLTMLWAIVAWPWLFTRLGLSTREGG
jgi:hypothetical protein